MKVKRFISAVLAAVIGLAAVPALGEDAVTRALAVYSFVEAAGEESFASGEGAAGAFEDWTEVPEEYRGAMELAVGRGIIKGSGDGKLHPNDSLTRLEAMLILGRCLPEVGEIRQAIDFADVPDWAEAEIDRLYRAEIVNGYGDGVLGSGDLITVEQLRLLTDRVRAAVSGLKDDFYNAVNREWIADAKPSADRPKVSYYTQRDEEIGAYLIERSEELLAEYKAGKRLHAAEEGAAKLYELALNDSYGTRPIEPIKTYLDRIQQSESLYELHNINGAYLRSISVPILFNVTIPVRMGESMPEALDGVYIGFLNTGIDKTYWQEDPEGVRSAYEAYISKLLKLAGIKADDETLSQVSAFQRDVALAGYSNSQYYSGSDESAQSVFTWEELRGAFSGKGVSYINSMLTAIDSYEMRDFGYYIVSDMGMVGKAVELMTDCDLDVVKTICKINFIEQMSDFLPRPFRDAYDSFNAEVTGVIDGGVISDKEYAARLAAMIYLPAYDADYVERYAGFGKNYLEDMTDDIMAAFKDILNGSDLISADAARQASLKLGKINTHICGYERGSDEPSDYYKVDSDASLLKNGLNMLKSFGGDIYSVVAFVDDPMPSYTVNAAYNSYINSINIYAGILFAPKYSPSASYEENLGGIGVTIAHEISHAFDGNGGYYDGEGNYDPWWSDGDRERFDDFVKKLNAYYEKYASDRGIEVDSGMTSNENIADILGMQCVIKVAKEKGLDLDKVFRSYARSWASASTAEYKDFLMRMDEHSPDILRVNAVLSNFDEFYETYGVKEGDGMYVPPEERVRMF